MRNGTGKRNERLIKDRHFDSIIIMNLWTSIEPLSVLFPDPERPPRIFTELTQDRQKSRECISINNHDYSYFPSNSIHNRQRGRTTDICVETNGKEEVQNVQGRGYVENASKAMLSSFLVGTSQERYLQAVSEIAKGLVEVCYPAEPSSS